MAPNYWNKIPFFSFFSQYSNTQSKNFSLVSYDEIMEIKKFFENKNYYGSDNTKDKLIQEKNKPDNYFFCIMNFKLEKAQIKISKRFNEKDEGLFLCFFDSICEVKLSENNAKINFQIGKFNIDHFSETFHHNKENKLSLLNSDKKSEKPCLVCLLETKKKNKDEKLGFRLYIEVGSIEFKFFPLILRRALSYFKFSSIDADLKEKAYKQVENLQKLSQVFSNFK